MGRRARGTAGVRCTPQDSPNSLQCMARSREGRMFQVTTAAAATRAEHRGRAPTRDTVPVHVCRASCRFLRRSTLARLSNSALLSAAALRLSSVCCLWNSRNSRSRPCAMGAGRVGPALVSWWVRLSPRVVADLAKGARCADCTFTRISCSESGVPRPEACFVASSLTREPGSPSTSLPVLGDMTKYVSKNFSLRPIGQKNVFASINR